MKIYPRTHSTPFFFFGTLARDKDESTLREKDFSASFLEIEVLLCHPIDLPVCRSNTYLPFLFGNTHARLSPSYFTSFVSLPEYSLTFLLRLLHKCIYVYASSWQNQHFRFGKQNSVFSAPRNLREFAHTLAIAKTR